MIDKSQIKPIVEGQTGRQVADNLKANFDYTIDKTNEEVGKLEKDKATVTSVSELDKKVDANKDETEKKIGELESIKTIGKSISEKGNDEIGIDRKVMLIPSHQYKVTIQTPWTFKSNEGVYIFQIYNKKDGQEENIVSCLSGYTVTGDYQFIAPAGNDFHVFFRAPKGLVVNLEIEDITGNLSTTNVIDMSGAGDVGTYKDFVAIQGHKYRVTVIKPWTYTIIGSGSVIFDLERRNAVSLNELETIDTVFAVNSGETVAKEYEFVAQEATYYSFFIRAKQGFRVQVIIEDITAIEDIYSRDYSAVIVGQGTQGVYKKFFARNGSRYRVSVNKTWQLTTEGGYIFSVGKFLDGQEIDYVIAPSGQLPQKDFYFTADENDMCYVFLRAPKGLEIQITITEIIGQTQAYEKNLYAEDIKRVDANRKLPKLYAQPEKLFTMFHFSDCHDSEVAITAGEITDFLKPDIVINTGDNVPTWSHQSIANVLEGKRKSNVPYLNVIGNHDVWTQSGHTDLTKAEIYRKYINPFIPEGLNPEQKTYYIYDDSRYKVRIIILDAYDGSSTYNRTADMSDEQLNWLYQMLNTTPEGYAVVVGIHQMLANYTLLPHKFTNEILTEGFQDTISIPAVYDLIQGYKDKSSGTTKSNAHNNPISYDFTSAKGDFVCMLIGHYHTDFIPRVEGYNFNIIAVDCILEDYSASDLLKDNGIVKDNRERVVINSLSIDKERKEIRLSRIGCKNAINVQRDFTVIKY